MGYFGRTYFAPAYYAAGYWGPAAEPPAPTTRGGTGLPERDDYHRFIREQDDEAAAWLLLTAW